MITKKMYDISTVARGYIRSAARTDTKPQALVSHSLQRFRKNRKRFVARLQRKGLKRVAFRVWLVSLLSLIIFVVNGRGKSPTVTMTRLVPRLHRELQRNFVDWKCALKKAHDQPKYTLTGSNLQVVVISLARTRERKHETVNSLEAQGIPWTAHIAVDGFDDLDMESVKKYAGSKKQRRLQVTQSLGQAQLVSMKRDYDDSKYIPTWLRISLHERLRFGCYISHVSIWQEILRKGAPFAVILEDDAVVAANFSNDLQERLQRLPATWDTLFLNGCDKKFGYLFDNGVRQSRGGLCTFAYVISSKGARHLLQRAVLRSDKPIDHVLDYETLKGRLLSFHADPPLAHTSHKKSTLAY